MTNNKLSIASVIVTGVVGVAGIVGVGLTSNAPVAPKSYVGVTVPDDVAQEIFRVGIEPCPTEDSNNCYWDGFTRGAKDGGSFVAWNGVLYSVRTYEN